MNYDELNNLFGETESIDDIDNFDDGNYEVSIQKVVLDTKKNSDELYFLWEFEIVSPETYRGGIMTKIVVFKNEKNIAYFKKDLTTCGLTFVSLDDLKNNLDNFLDIKLNIYYKKDGAYSKIYINSISDSDIHF